MKEYTHRIGSHLAQQGADYDTVGSIATNVADGFTMVAVGDLIVSRPLTRYEHSGFSDIVKILCGADVIFGNMETLIFDIRKFKGSPEAEHGGVRITSAYRNWALI